MSWQTFRVENIPSSTTREQVPALFSRVEGQNIKVRSLAASAHSDKELIATISFQVQGDEPPTPLDDDTTVDSSLYGLTPLNIPKEPCVAE